MSKVAWIIFGAVIVLVLGGLIAYSRINSPSADVKDINSASIVGASDANGNIADHVYGNTESKVLLIEYGDFQCPSCGAAHPQIKELAEEYKDRIGFVFRNFPLTSIHPNARAASAAVEAAGLQGKYWEMHDLVFESQNEWSSITDGTQRTNIFVGYAESLGLNKDQFTTDLAASTVNQKISFDQALGKKLGVNATPTFYINNDKVSDEASSSAVQGDTTALKTLIDAALAK